MPYHQLVEELAPLEVLPAEAFQGSVKMPQHVCNFVLALAVVYNDFLDIATAHVLLQEVQPAAPEEVSIEAGHFGGLFTALLRLQAGVIHELLELLKKNRNATRDPAFLTLIGAIDEQARSAWNVIQSVADGHPKKDALGTTLHYLRNKVSFHYDTKVLGRGLADYIQRDPKRQLFISRGGTMRSARFYFADAAAEAALVGKLEEPAVKEFFTFKGPLIQGVNRALYQIVTVFVEHRGYSYKLHRPVT